MWDLAPSKAVSAHPAGHGGWVKTPSKKIAPLPRRTPEKTPLTFT